eukprot:gene45027-19225_t
MSLYRMRHPTCAKAEHFVGMLTAAKAQQGLPPGTVLDEWVRNIRLHPRTLRRHRALVSNRIQFAPLCLLWNLVLYSAAPADLDVWTRHPDTDPATASPDLPAGAAPPLVTDASKQGYKEHKLAQGDVHSNASVPAPFSEANETIRIASGEQRAADDARARAVERLPKWR